MHAQRTQSSRQPASQLNAKQAAAGLRQVPPGREGRRKRSVLRFQAHQQAVWAPDHQARLEHTHIPLRHLPSLLNAHSCPFPKVLVSERPSMSGQEFITSQHLGLASACCMASAPRRPYTLRLLSPYTAPAFQWDDQQFRNDSQREFCSPVKLHPVLLQEQ